jgi:hypothetical protein
MPCPGSYRTPSTFFLSLFSLVMFVETPAQAQQWTGPDASSNIYNANAAAGAGIVHPATSNGGRKF